MIRFILKSSYCKINILSYRKSTLFNWLSHSNGRFNHSKLGLLSLEQFYNSNDLIEKSIQAIAKSEKIRRILHSQCQLLTEESIKVPNKLDLLFARDQTNRIDGNVNLVEFKSYSEQINDIRTDNENNKERYSNESNATVSNVIDSNQRIFEADITLKLLDSLSNTICIITDACEFIRNVHHDQQYRLKADEAFATLSTYIHELNADYKIYKLLCFLDQYNAYLNQESCIFVADLKREYENEGIHLSIANNNQNSNEIRLSSPDDPVASLQYSSVKDGSNTHIILIQQELNDLEARFHRNLTENDCKFYSIGPIKEAWNDYKQWLTKSMIHFNPPVLDHSLQSQGYLLTCSDKSISGRLMTSIDDAMIRRQIWEGSYSQPEENKIVIGNLIYLRQKLAHILGYKSYVHKYLAGNYAYAEPRQVTSLLDDITKSLESKLETEIKTLVDLKYDLIRKDIWSSDVPLRTPSSALTLSPYDINYLIWIARSKISQDKSSHNVHQSIRQYLRLDVCLQGLAFLSQKLFGLDIEIVDPVPADEAWTASKSLTDGVAKLIITSPQTSSAPRKQIGVVYLDIFHRNGKFYGAGHFTIRCGCEVMSTDFLDGRGDAEGPIFPRNHTINEQTPVVALNFSFHTNDRSSQNGMPLMRLTELETMYHEWGHAMHSLLSRTKYQHLSGTRCPVDFAEVPSHLFEYFARSPRVISQWAHNPATGSFIPIELLEEALQSMDSYQAIDTQRQVFYSSVDQTLFGERFKYDEIHRMSINEIYDAADTAAVDMQCKYLSFMDTTDTKLKSSMSLLTHTHIINYGGGYYAYLFSKLYAAQIWDKRFRSDPLSRKNGEILMNDMLRYGASKPSVEILNHMIQGPLNPSHYLSYIVGN